MLQRAAIAAASANQPRLLLADEPTASLDASLAVDVVLGLRERSAGRRGGGRHAPDHPPAGTGGAGGRPGGGDVRRAAGGDRPGPAGPRPPPPPLHPRPPGGHAPPGRRAPGAPGRGAARRWPRPPPGCAFSARCPLALPVLPASARPRRWSTAWPAPWWSGRPRNGVPERGASRAIGEPAPPGSAVLRLQDVTVRYGATTALDGVSLDVAAGRAGGPGGRTPARARPPSSPSSAATGPRRRGGCGARPGRARGCCCRTRWPRSIPAGRWSRSSPSPCATAAPRAP